MPEQKDEPEYGLLFTIPQGDYSLYVDGTLGTSAFIAVGNKNLEELIRSMEGILRTIKDIKTE